MNSAVRECVPSREHYGRIACWSGALSALIALLVFVGLVLELGALKSFRADFMGARPEAVLGFFLAGLAVVAISPEKDPRTWAGVALTTSSLVVLLGLALVVGRAYAPGISLIIVGTSLTLHSRRVERSFRLMHAVGLSLGLAALFSLLCHLLVLTECYVVLPSVWTPFPISLALLLLGVAMLCLAPHRGVMRYITSDTQGGLLARRLLPAVLIIPLVLARLRIAGQERGLFGTDFGIALLAFGNIILLMGMVWLAARTLYHQDRLRCRVEEATRRSQRDLEMMLNSIGEAVIATDRGGHIVRMNPEAERLTGWVQQEAFRQPLDRIYRVREEVARASGFRGVVRMSGEWDVAGRHAPPLLVCRDGRQRYIAGCRAPIHGEEGDTGGAVIVFRDITEERRAEEALRESERRYRQIVETCYEGIWLLDAGHRTTFANQRMAEMLGYPIEEMVGRPLFDFMEPADRRCAEMWLEQWQAGIREQREIRLLRRDNGLLWGLFSVASLEREGVNGGLLAMVTDITERKRAASLLQESEERFRATFEQAAVGISQVSPDGWPVRVNQRLSDILGYTQDEMLSMNLLEVIHPEDRESIIAEHRRLLAGEIPTCSRETRFLSRRVDVVWVHLTTSLVRGPGGERRYFVSIVQDISQRKRMEHEREVSEKRYQAVGELIPFGVWACDEHGRLNYLSQSFRDMLGMTFEQCVGDDLEKRLPTGQLQAVGQAWRECVARGGLWDYQFMIRDHDGQSRAILSRGVPIRDAGGLITGWVGLHLDVTDRQRVEEELRAASVRLKAVSNRVLEIQEQERSVIARELHDEIGQVLTAVSIHLQAIQRLPEAAPLVQRLEDCIRITDFALQQIRSMSLNLRPPQIDDLGLVAAVRWFVDRQTRETQLGVHIATELQDQRFAPELETGCFRIVQEAVTNVVRHAMASRLRVEIQQQEEALQVRIWDDGVGFDSDAAHERAVRGHSMGLLGMRERAALLGGRLEIRSTYRVGTEVLALFPLEPWEGYRPGHHLECGE